MERINIIFTDEYGTNLNRYIMVNVDTNEEMTVDLSRAATLTQVGTLLKADILNALVNAINLSIDEINGLIQINAEVRLSNIESWKSNTNTDISNLKSNISIHTSEISSLTDDLSQLESDLNQTKNNLSETNEIVTDLNEDIPDLRNKVTSLDNKVNGFDNRISNNEAQTSSNTQNLIINTAAIANLNTNYNELDSRVSTADSKANANATSINNINQELDKRVKTSKIYTFENSNKYTVSGNTITLTGEEYSYYNLNLSSILQLNDSSNIIIKCNSNNVKVFAYSQYNFSTLSVYANSLLFPIKMDNPSYEINISEMTNLISNIGTNNNYVMYEQSGNYENKNMIFNIEYDEIGNCTIRPQIQVSF